MASILGELKRRNVFRVATVYMVGGWVLMQIADILFSLLSVPDGSMRLVFGILLLGFPVAVIFAWVYELTPEGLKRATEVDPNASITPDTGRKLDRVIIAALGVAVVVLLVDKFFLAPELPTEATTQAPAEVRREIVPSAEVLAASIAVLPFADMSAGADHEYFGDGIAEELLNLLAKIPDLKVAGRTSSFAFKGDNQDLRIIGEQLDVATVLEGSVRRAGDKVRVTAQLVSANDGFHLWSESYDREFDDVFAIQDDIAGRVVDALKVTLLGEAPAPAPVRRTENMQAYENVLRARQLFDGAKVADVWQAIELADEAIRLDPDYAMAHAALGTSLLAQESIGIGEGPQTLERALAAADRAIELDPQLSLAWALKGELLSWSFEPDEDVAVAFERALAINPNDATALRGYGLVRARQGHVDEAREHMVRAQTIDPLSSWVNWDLGAFYQATREFDKALATYEHMREVDPRSPNGYYGAAQTYASMGNLAQGAVWNLKAFEIDPNDHELPLDAADRFVEMGLAGEALEQIEIAEAMVADSPTTSAYWGRIYYELHLGDRDKAIALAREALATDLPERNSKRLAMSDVVATRALRKARDSGAGPDDPALQEAVRLFRQTAPRLFQSPPELRSGFVGIPGATLVMLLRATGDNAGAQAVSEAIVEHLDGRPDGTDKSYLNTALARLAAAEGDSDLAVEVLQASVDQGWAFAWPYVLNFAGFDAMHEDKNFAALIEHIENDLAENAATLVDLR
jgi:TolB-like protein/Tfp pilus assembly protein PilF